MHKLIAGVMMLAVAGFADIISTNTYTFSDNGALKSLAHSSAYTWGINLNLADNEVITGAKLEISNVYNWQDNEWNALWINLLDDASAGVTYKYDGDATSNANYFTTGLVLDRLHWNEDYDDNRYMTKNSYGQWVWVYGKGINDGLYSNRSGYDILIDGDKNNKVTITFGESELAALTSYLGNDNFGFGIDPDCHFYTSGFNFTVDTKTTNVPEPTMLTLLGFGFFGLCTFRRKK